MPESQRSKAGRAFECWWENWLCVSLTFSLQMRASDEVALLGENYLYGLFVNYFKRLMIVQGI